MADEQAKPIVNPPSWLTELIDILEGIWGAISAKTMTPAESADHPVAQKIAALKAKLPNQ